MSDEKVPPRWRFLLAPQWLSWHLFIVVAVIGMTWLCDWQLRRALAGNTLSWAYTFEWPIFAIFAIVFWVKTIRDEFQPAAAGDDQPGEITLPAGVRRAQSAAGQPAEQADSADGADDLELAEYNAYLAKLSNEVKGHGRWHGLR